MSFEYILANMENDDFELSYSDEFMDDGVIVYVSKVGGGTLGKNYDGAWLYRYERNGKVLAQSEMVTGSAHDHYWVAIAVNDFYSE